MVSRFLEQHQQSLIQNPIFDALLCEEERFDDDFDSGFGLKSPESEVFSEIQFKSFNSIFEHDLFWEDDEVVTLLDKEKTQSNSFYDENDRSLKMARNEGIKWMLKVVAHYGFATLTAVLAVNYYDRFLTSQFYQKEKPWMSQLAAVACLSIAAKVEETQVPLLLDLQVEEAKFVFESKTIQRMEILILSALGWKMNPVTPISYFDHIVRRFGLMTGHCSDFLRRCESVVQSIISDCRLVHYLPSVIAAATMQYVFNEQCDSLEYQNQLISVLGIDKEKIDDCYKFITGILNDDHYQILCLKRKRATIPPNSPSGVIDAYFSSDSSNESWSVASSVSSSPEPLTKRGRSPLSNLPIWRG